MRKSDVIAAVKAAGMHARWDRDAGEWRVTLPYGEASDERRKAIAYYTDDADDAIATAKAMRAQWDTIYPDGGRV